jgi:hypothetical protein
MATTKKPQIKVSSVTRIDFPCGDYLEIDTESKKGKCSLCLCDDLEYEFDREELDELIDALEEARDRLP